MERELYEKVIIGSESDLPKYGTYFAYLKSANQVSLMIMSEGYKHFWMEDVEWYLLPIPQPNRKTAEEILEGNGFFVPDDNQYLKAIKGMVLKSMHEFALQSMEMPSEEEIEKAADELCRVEDRINVLMLEGFVRCAKWLKSKLS